MESPSTAPATVPACFHHKGSGQAAVKLGGRFVYLGAFGSEEAQLRYRRVVAEWRASGGSAALQVVQVKHVIAGYWKHAEVYYRKNGKPTSELSVLKLSMRFLAQLYGDLPAAKFGPLKLKACREEMIRSGLARTTINGFVSRIRQAFRWAVENELVPAPVHQALQAVPGLKKGRTLAREPVPVRPVDGADMEAVMPHVSRQVAAMIRLQWLTGMRPSGRASTSGARCSPNRRHPASGCCGTCAAEARRPRPRSCPRRLCGTTRGMRRGVLS